MQQVEYLSGIQVHPSTFPGVFNLANELGEGFGHVMNREPYNHDWTAWFWLNDGDEYQGTFATREAAIQAMSVLAP